MHSIPRLFRYFLCLIVTKLFILNASFAQDVTIIDSRHYSNVFGEFRNFRIFLPPGYYNNPDKKYPVIYFLHGWAQRYFGEGSEEYASYDKGNQNKGDNISNFVSTHDVIIVKPDGYNRSDDEPYYKRPYNVTPVETYRQFPIYFPELVKYIDDHFHTVADREHRALSGLSMGGFMTFWIGAKYPHLLSAAGSFCGAPEFIVGPITIPVEYRHIEMYKNFAGMNLRLNYGDKDFIRGYHQDMNRIWPQVMNNYEWKIYDAEHSTCGLGEMFESFMKTFQDPPKKPDRWDHIEVYPEFSVWDYQVSTDRNVSGFTVLENVDSRGFRCAVREFVPDGELLSNVNVIVTTSPVYEKNQLYTINDIDATQSKINQKTIRSDNEGRLTISFNGSMHEIGINKKADKPEITVASFDTGNMPWVIQDKEITFNIKLLNKGLSEAKNVRATLSATRNNVKILQGGSSFGNIAVNEMQAGKAAFVFKADKDSLEITRLRIDVKDGNNNEWHQIIDLPIEKDADEIKDFVIADGKIFNVAAHGNDVEPVLLGSGNGDGIANPGESIVLLVKDKGKYWRTRLSYSDKYINPFGINRRISDVWTNFDHIGASVKYNIPLLSSDCPENHTVQFLASYWLPEYPYHTKKQGIIKLNIKGSDKTPPVIESIQVQGDNTIETKLYDGADIKNVRAILILKDDPTKTLNVELKDDGSDGDRTEKDRVFSRKLPDQKFNLYRVIIEASDAFGNKTSRESEKTFVLH